MTIDTINRIISTHTKTEGDYAASLELMSRAEKKLSAPQRKEYAKLLLPHDGNYFDLVFVTSTQKAKAFVTVIGQRYCYWGIEDGVWSTSCGQVFVAKEFGCMEIPKCPSCKKEARVLR